MPAGSKLSQPDRRASLSSHRPRTHLLVRTHLQAQPCLSQSIFLCSSHGGPFSSTLLCSLSPITFDFRPNYAYFIGQVATFSPKKAKSAPCEILGSVPGRITGVGQNLHLPFGFQLHLRPVCLDLSPSLGFFHRSLHGSVCSPGSLLSLVSINNKAEWLGVGEERKRQELSLHISPRTSGHKEVRSL